jgi:hypothetical protein
MLETIAALTPAERAAFKDPDFITEDEADLVFSDLRSGEAAVPALESFAVNLSPAGWRARRRETARSGLIAAEVA